MAFPIAPDDEPRSLERIVFVSRTFPSGFDLSVNGVYQRMRLFLEAAQAISRRLEILFFVEESFLGRLDPATFSVELKRHWGIDAVVHFAAREPDGRSWFTANIRPFWDVRSHSHVYKTGGRRQGRAIDALLQEPADLIFAFKFESALPLLVSNVALPPMALDLDDIEHVKYPRMLARQPNGWRKALEYGYWPSLISGERRAIRTSTVSFVCSKTARDYLDRAVGSRNIRIAPNAVAFPAGARPVGARHHRDAAPILLFVGIFAYPPNSEAAGLLATQIFPRVLKEIPEARLVFVGAYVEMIRHLQDAAPNIEMRGFVDDLASVYEEAALACCPIMAGGGTRTKIIEAAAFHLPVVATTLGAEGIEFDDGTEIVLRDDPESFAAACVALLRDPERASRIADAAYRRARMYERSAVIAQIASDLRDAATNKTPRMTTRPRIGTTG